MVGMRAYHMLSSSDKSRRNVSEDSYSMLMNSSNPVFVINRKGKFADVNDTFCKKIGIKKHEVLGTPVGDAKFLTEDSRKKVMFRHVSRLIGKETPVYTLDAFTKGGDVLSLEIDTKPFVKHGKDAGEISIVRRMTKTSKSRGRKKTVKKRDDEVTYLMGEIKQKNDGVKQIKNELEPREEDLDIYRKDMDRINKRLRQNET